MSTFGSLLPKVYGTHVTVKAGVLAFCLKKNAFIPEKKMIWILKMLSFVIHAGMNAVTSLFAEKKYKS